MRKLSKVLLIFLSVFLITMLCAYVIGACMNWHFNPALWDEGIRTGIFGFGGAIGIASGIIMASEMKVIKV